MTTWTVARGLLCPWNSPSKNTGVGNHSLLQGDLPDPGIEPRYPSLQVGFFYHPSHQGSPCLSANTLSIYDGSGIGGCGACLVVGLWSFLSR